ncbi:MAG: C40 family peptidase [Bacteroidetes bacterium]|nr:C40 family peptidase [Bacteroidota bacterium]
MFGICNLSIVPCRKDPSDKSEMVTQLLFGEHFQLLDTKGNWQLIRIAYDGYECWIDKKQFLPLSEKTINGIKDSTTALTTDLVQLASPLTESDTRQSHRTQPSLEQQHIPIVLGSSLPKYKENCFWLGKEKYSFEGAVGFPFEKTKAIPCGEGVSGVAAWYLNTPYLWGGRSPFGIDCSGFTQMVFKLNGIQLQRDAWQQAEQGKVLSFLEEAQTGDLAFFDNEEGKIVHVGIITTPSIPIAIGTPKGVELRAQSPSPLGKVGMGCIHASGKVRIDKLDHHGIFNEETKKYSHRLRVIKRCL